MTGPILGLGSGNGFAEDYSVTVYSELQEETAVSTLPTHEKKPFFSHSLKATSLSPGHPDQKQDD